MNKEWIDGWKEEIKMDSKEPKVSLIGSTSTSKNLDVALINSKCLTDYGSDKQPVLFVYSIINYHWYAGFKMNDKRFSVYPREQEHLLPGDFEFMVIDVEENFQI